MAVAKLPEIPRPTLGVRKNQENTNPVDSDRMNTLLDEATNLVKTKARSAEVEDATKILGAVTSSGKQGGSEIPTGIGELLGGATKAMGTSAELAMMVAKTMIENARTNGDGKGNELNVILMTLVTTLLEHILTKEQPAKDTSRDDILLKLMEIQSNNHKETMAMQEKHHQERENDLKARSGASELDRAVQGQLLPMLIQNTMAAIASPQDPKEQIRQLAEWKKILKELDGDHPANAITPEYLQFMGLQFEHDAKMAELKDNKDARDASKEPPAWLAPVTNLLTGFAGNATAKNFMATQFATPADEQAAARMMGGMQ